MKGGVGLKIGCALCGVRCVVDGLLVMGVCSFEGDVGVTWCLSVNDSVTREFLMLNESGKG